MTNQELQEIKDRLGQAHPTLSVITERQVNPDDYIITIRTHKSLGVFLALAANDIAALIAEVERLRAVIAANPVMSKGVQKGLRAQVLDATSEGKGKITFPRKSYDLAGPENRHIAHMEGHSNGQS